ncbi:hypothetical protein ARMGADRAFT_1017726 [Armillaria gallica]|uniref:Secreted protein n=1 Tax=Armillaria gallica TaxID=47427 RepID=A0A2H3CW05_ARMGA|nr:hypothetical protein ARMGADRAFT_1017726 [Armillaria gallica]
MLVWEHCGWLALLAVTKTRISMELYGLPTCRETPYLAGEHEVGLSNVVRPSVVKLLYSVFPQVSTCFLPASPWYTSTCFAD